MLEELFGILVHVLLATNAMLFVFVISSLIWSRYNPVQPRSRKSVHILAIIGSGGHTTEMLKLLNGLGEHYSQRTYVLANTDQMSEQKVINFEQKRPSGKFSIEKIPRSREVGQSYFSSIWTTLIATLCSLTLVWRTRPDVVLSNGPGTALPICASAFLFDCLQIITVQVIYVESICRVKSLSLTALILYKLRLANCILVQWPELMEAYPRTKYIGRLI